jgi:hypothetical protein
MPFPDVVQLRKHFVRAFMFAAVILSGSSACANPHIADAVGSGSCSDCHARDKEPTYDTLNAIGLKYLGCQRVQACYERVSAGLRNGQQAVPAQAPAYTPPAYAPPAPVEAKAALPRGSYQNRCRDVTVNPDNTNLYGLCANRQNQTVYSRLAGFPNCQSDIAVDGDGYLGCNLRGGGTAGRERVIQLGTAGWNMVTQLRTNTGSGGSWIQHPDLGVNKSYKLVMSASTPCVVHATHASGSFTMNTCMYHKATVAGANVRFE